MNEAFLWYLWKYRLYNKELNTTDGENVIVEHPGYQNHDSGPDFFNARVRIGDTRWAGNVEIHVRSSDWFKHEHHYDRAYDNIILHVVHDADVIVRRPDGQVIPVIALKDDFDSSKWSDYQKLTNSPGWVPCAKQLTHMNPIIIENWLNRVLVNRLEKKAQIITDNLEEFKGNWAECFFVLLARNFGFKVNALPFELLARTISYKTLLRHKDNLFQLEALLLGQAGFLAEDFNDDYPKRLKIEYQYLKNKLGLQPLEKHLWKFGRLRPGNFPTIRLAQLAGCIHQNSDLISKIIGVRSIQELQALFNFSASDYWSNHYLPDKSTKLLVKSLGASSIDNIIINTIAPFLFVYGKKEMEPGLSDMAINLLEECPSEKNNITYGWEKTGIKATTAATSQALIELKAAYCLEKKCLTCGIGIKLLNQ